MQQPAGRRNPVPGAIALVGGVVVVVGSLLPWVRFSIFRFSNTIYGTGSTDGKIVVALGIAAVLTGLLMVALSSVGPQRALAVVVLLCGLGTVYVTGKNVVTKDRQTTDALRNLIEQRTGRPATDRQLRALRSELRSFGFSLDFGAGIYVALAGGAIAAVGGLLGLVLGGERGPAGPSDWAGSVPAQGWAPAGEPSITSTSGQPYIPSEEPSLPSEEPSITASPGWSSAGSASGLPQPPPETAPGHGPPSGEATPDWEPPPAPERPPPPATEPPPGEEQPPA